MKEKDKISRSGFFRYRKGEMSEREKNAFERELQKDPFAAEADEGFSAISVENAETDLAMLDTRLKSKSGRSNRFVIYRIAASVAVLMIISSVFIFVRKNYESIKEEDAVTAVQVPVEIEKAKPIVGETKKDEKESIAVHKAVIPEEAQMRNAETKMASGENVIAADVKAVDAENMEVKDDLLFEKENKAEPVVAEPAYPAATVTAAAYGARKKSVPETEEYKLDEIAVIGYGKQIPQEPGFTPALPAEGKKSFNDYIEGSIKVPETLKEGERVVVLISFLVKTTGEIDSIKVVRSPGDDFSYEAKRLILEGPQWKPAKQDGKLQDDEVRLRIVFTK